MINQISVRYNQPAYKGYKSPAKSKVQNSTLPVFYNTQDNKKFLDAYKGYAKIYNTPQAVSFCGVGGLSDAFEKLSAAMVTCRDEEAGKKGEEVAKRINVNDLIYEFEDVLPKYDDTVKTTVEIARDNVKGETLVSDARIGVKKGKEGTKLEVFLRPQRIVSEDSHKTKFPKQILEYEIKPYEIKSDDNNKKIVTGTEENVYILNTKGKLMAVVEDTNTDDVLLTSAGRIKKKDSKDGVLKVSTRQFEVKDKDGKNISPLDLANLCSKKAIENGEDKGIQVRENKFTPFEVDADLTIREKEGTSEGGGAKMVIGLEDGRFVPETIASIEEFVEKVNSGEIVLDKFVPAEGAENIQINMLAGGFGSRAEYSNASSSRIMHGKKKGSNMTKGCFRTATGLTPMETTFISLHKAGLLDCSKGNIGIGKNIGFYLNDSGANSGNGGFSVDMNEKTTTDNIGATLIFPNDSMSRNPVAIRTMTDMMNEKTAAMVMIAKQVEQETARGALGVMKINEDGEIEAFAEKPETFEDGYVDENGNCFANTFQFAVSKEAFDALSLIEEYLPAKKEAKESRDWSKVLTPILMSITKNDDTKVMQKEITEALKNKYKGKEGLVKDIPEDVLSKAKQILGNQKIYAVKTDEPWADCGTLNALYHTTLQIVSGDFPLEDFERVHAIKSVNTKTGLVASSPEQKAEIEEKYDIDGQVMAVKQAKVVKEDMVKKYRDSIIKHSDFA